MAEELPPFKILVPLVLILLLVGSVFAATYNVNSGERVVVTRFGETHSTADAGLNFRIPLIDDIHTYNVRTQTMTFSSDPNEGDVQRADQIPSLSAEGLSVNIEATIRYNVNPTEVARVYSDISPTDEGMRGLIVRPKSREVVRACTQEFNTTELYRGGQERLGTCVEEYLAEDFENNGLVLQSVQIRDIQLPRSVANSIEEKQAAQQRIETAQRQLEIAEVEAEQRRVEAQGIRDAQEIISETLTQEYLNYLWITEGLQQGDTIYMVPSDGNGQPTLTHEVSEDDEETNNSTAVNYHAAY